MLRQCRQWGHGQFYGQMDLTSDKGMGWGKESFDLLLLARKVVVSGRETVMWNVLQQLCWQRRGFEGVEWKLLCATGALSVGINVKNLRLVLHCGEPWYRSDFMQESGRSGRKSEEVKSALFIS